MSERKYFLIAEGSPVMAVIQACIEQQAAFYAAIKEVQGEYGATDVWSWENSRFAGLVFAGAPPEGWRRSPGKAYCVPSLKTKAGREIKKRLDRLPTAADGFEISRMLGGEEYTHWGDGMVYWSNFQVYGDKRILSVPVQCTVQPPGCVELKMSEYWQIVEEHKVQAA